MVVTMKVTPTTEKELEKAKKVIYIEADAVNDCKSRIRIISDTVENGEFWMLNKFMDILQ